MRLILIAVFILTQIGYLEACNVCHSKNPKMVNMHRELGFKDCFKCHGPTSKRTKGDLEMKTSSLCRDCHLKSSN